jgi:hypothetical protein
VQYQRVFGSVAALQLRNRKASFWIRAQNRVNGALSQISQQSQKIFTKFLRFIARDLVFEPLGVAMGISD